MPFFFDMWMPAVPEADPALITDSSPFPPLAQLLPRCKAIIHTGSSAATAAALAHDLPQIIYPFSHDQEAMVSSYRLSWKVDKTQLLMKLMKLIMLTKLDTKAMYVRIHLLFMTP